MSNPFFSVEELLDIENEVTEIEMDLSSNSNLIFTKPSEMKVKVEEYLNLISNIESRLNFFKNSNVESDVYNQIKNLEKKIAIIKNQLALDLKSIRSFNN